MSSEILLNQNQCQYQDQSKIRDNCYVTEHYEFELLSHS